MRYAAANAPYVGYLTGFDISQNSKLKTQNLKLKMKIAFIDFSNWDYKVESPYQIPLGGSQSAMCYLAEALAGLGHEVFLFNNTSAPGLSRGVQCLSFNLVSARLLQSLDALIVSNVAGEGIGLRSRLGKQTRLVLWTQQVPTLQIMQGLQDRATQDAYDRIVFVSEWQRHLCIEHFGLEPARTAVLRNAIAPAFAGLFAENALIVPHKSQPPVLAYTSTPFRGLDLLVDIFPRIREAVPGTRLKVFSSKKVYQLDRDLDESFYGSLYEKCRQTEGIEYVGSLPQPELARELRSVTALAYANTFKETSCIAVVEAMASGCLVVTSDLAALPETSAGFARLVSVADVHTFSDVRDWQFSQKQDWQAYGDRFVETTVQLLRECDRGEISEIFLRRMVDYINSSCTWPVRAREWEQWLREICGQSGDIAATPSQTPASQTPASQTPASQTPASQTSVSQTSVSQTPVIQTPVSQIPVSQIPVSQTPVSQTPVSQTPVSQIPVSQTPISQTSVSDRVFSNSQAEPGLAEQLTRRAEVDFRNNNIEAAIATLKQSLQVDPNFAPTYNTLANCYQARGQIQTAIEHYARAIKLDPHFAQALVNLGSMYYWQWRLDEAIYCYEKAIEKIEAATAIKLSIEVTPPESGAGAAHLSASQKYRLAATYWNLALVCDRQSRWDEAIAYLREALALQPELAGAEFHLKLGNRWLERGELEEAASSFQRALQLQPNYVEAYVNLGIVWRRAGKLEEAASSYRRAIALNPKLAMAYFSLGNVLYDLGLFVEAKDSYQKAIDLEPDLAEAYCGLGNALHQLELSPSDLSSIAAYSRAIELKPDYAEAYFYLVNPLANRGRLREAIESSERALRLKPDLARQHFALDLSGYSAPKNKTISASTRELAQSYSEIAYRQIYPASQVSLSAPFSLGKNLDRPLLEPFSGYMAESPAAFVAVIPNGRAWGDRAAGVVITRDNRLLADVSNGGGKVALVFSVPELPPIYAIDGTVAFLSLQAGDYYYHWMLDVLPRLHLLRLSDISLDAIDFFVFNDIAKPFQQETLKILGIPQEKTIASQRRPHIQARRLVTTSIPTNIPKWSGRFMEGPPRWVCQFLRSEFLPLVQGNARYQKREKSDKPERIYINRQQAGHRRLINETEVIRLLGQFGFVSVSLESLSVLEQVELLASARVVVAPHGGGLTNLVFCQPGTKVIEIFSHRYVSSCYWLTSNYLDLEYYYLVGEEPDRSQRLPKTHFDAIFEDILVNIDDLKNLMGLIGLEP